VFFRLFADYFVDPDDELRERLCSAATYGHLTAARRAVLAPIIVRFFSTLTDWRNIQACIETILSFPRDIIVLNWDSLSTLVFTAVAEYPHPLANSARDFCAVLAAFLTAHECAQLFEKIRVWFLKSEVSDMRRIFPMIVTELVVGGKMEMSLDLVVHELSVLANDPVSSVQTAVIRNLTRLRQYYFANEDAGKEREIVALFMMFGKSESQHVLDVWGAVWKVFQDSRTPIALRASEFQALPVPLFLRHGPAVSCPRALAKCGMLRGMSGLKPVHAVMSSPPLVKPKLPDPIFG
jgi:hypothetical protein